MRARTFCAALSLTRPTSVKRNRTRRDFTQMPSRSALNAPSSILFSVYFLLVRYKKVKTCQPASKQVWIKTKINFIIQWCKIEKTNKSLINSHNKTKCDWITNSSLSLLNHKWLVWLWVHFPCVSFVSVLSLMYLARVEPASKFVQSSCQSSSAYRQNSTCCHFASETFYDLQMYRKTSTTSSSLAPSIGDACRFSWLENRVGWEFGVFVFFGFIDKFFNVVKV